MSVFYITIYSISRYTDNTIFYVNTMTLCIVLRNYVSRYIVAALQSIALTGWPPSRVSFRGDLENVLPPPSPLRDFKPRPSYMVQCRALFNRSPKLSLCSVLPPLQPMTCVIVEGIYNVAECDI